MANRDWKENNLQPNPFEGTDEESISHAVIGFGNYIEDECTSDSSYSDAILGIDARCQWSAQRPCSNCQSYQDYNVPLLILTIHAKRTKRIRLVVITAIYITLFVDLKCGFVSIVSLSSALNATFSSYYHGQTFKLLSIST